MGIDLNRMEFIRFITSMRKNIKKYELKYKLIRNNIDREEKKKAFETELEELKKLLNKLEKKIKA